jgi:hypothetical protein
MTEPALTPKQLRVAQIRDDALRILLVRRAWESSPDDRWLAANTKECRISYRTPFQRSAKPPEVVRLAGGNVDQSYQLDVWFRQEKVLSILWEDGRDFEITSFEPGEWERELSRAALP